MLRSLLGGCRPDLPHPLDTTINRQNLEIRLLREEGRLLKFGQLVEHNSLTLVVSDVVKYLGNDCRTTDQSYT